MNGHRNPTLHGVDESRVKIRKDPLVNSPITNRPLTFGVEVVEVNVPDARNDFDTVILH